MAADTMGNETSPLVVFAAPGLLRERGRHPERQQPHQHLHGWQDVLLEPGHAFSAAGKQT